MDKNTNKEAKVDPESAVYIPPSRKCGEIKPKTKPTNLPHQKFWFHEIFIDPT